MLLIILAIVFTSDAQLQRQPFGPKMCQQLCIKIDCRNHTYDDSLLRCVLMISDMPAKDNVGKRDEGGRTSREKHWGMIDLRRKTNKCLESPVRMLPNSQDDLIADGRSLLVVPLQGNPSYITEIRINDYSKRWFPYFVSKLKSVLYLTSSKTFIISRNEMQQVISFDPFLKRTTLFFKHTPISIMVCDERKMLVFYVSARSMGRRLGRFSTNGSSHRFLPNLPCHATSAAINEEKQQIYLSLLKTKEIVSLNYEGRAMNTLKDSVEAVFLYYIANTQLLYFQDMGLHVRNIDLNDMHISKVVKPGLLIKSGVVLGKNLYLSSYGVNEIHVIDLQTYNVTIIKLQYKVFLYSTLLLI